MLTVTGFLDQMYERGGETTGWVLELDTELEVGAGRGNVRHIEVDPDDKPLDLLKGKKVRVAGELAWRYGVERGDYPVIFIDSIVRIHE